MSAFDNLGYKHPKLEDQTVKAILANPKAEIPEIAKRVMQALAIKPKTTEAVKTTEAEAKQLKFESPATEETLLPAIKEGEGINVGTEGQTHNDILANASEADRGFVTPEGQFIGRAEASNWLQQNRPDLYEKLSESAKKELHSEDLAKAIQPEPIKPMTTEDLQKVAEKTSTMPSDDKIDTVKKLDDTEKTHLDEGQKVADICNGKGMKAFKE